MSKSLPSGVVAAFAVLVGAFVMTTIHTPCELGRTIEIGGMRLAHDKFDVQDQLACWDIATSKPAKCAPVH